MHGILLKSFFKSSESRFQNYHTTMTEPVTESISTFGNAQDNDMTLKHCGCQAFPRGICEVYSILIA